MINFTTVRTDWMFVGKNHRHFSSIIWSHCCLSLTTNSTIYPPLLSALLFG